MGVRVLSTLHGGSLFIRARGSALFGIEEGYATEASRRRSCRLGSILSYGIEALCCRTSPALGDLCNVVVHGDWIDPVGLDMDGPMILGSERIHCCGNGTSKCDCWFTNT